MIREKKGKTYCQISKIRIEFEGNRKNEGGALQDFGLY